MDKTQSFTFDFTVDGCTLDQADALLNIIISVASAMGLTVGGGAFDVTDTDPDAGGE